MPLEPTDSTAAARGSLEMLICVTILVALLVGGVGAVRLGVDFVQLLAHVEVRMPG